MTDSSMQYNEILAVQSQLHELQYKHWLHHELFTYQWWALVVLLIIPWIIWWKLVDKTKTAIILAYGIYIMFVVTAMDAIGSALQLWIYPIKLLPIIPDSIGINWGLLTVAHMLVYQYFPRWKSFIVAESIFAAVLAFLGEPFAEWYGVYTPLQWEHISSFPIYLMKAVIGKWLIERLVFHKKF
ncbi:CBO0543 family protein [Sporomusa sp.]|uniref:CBO0543 family protein n=1 Tax=Sporomusa sp. TaxID=2078658 RepID=UPI002BEDAF2C|nr:CBO0543 family protein [Sporomusa sp.]HWR42263.1 CBO0543 family protein [Sporomusa sp.]